VSVTIVTQPVDQFVTDGENAVFSVGATGVGTLTYQWYETTAGLIAGATASSLLIQTTLELSLTSYYVIVTDDEDSVQSGTAKLSVVPYRYALVWNFEDDNYTWMDAAVDNIVDLTPVVCMQYEFNPGWQARWSDLQDAATIWGADGDTTANNLSAGTDPWGNGERPTRWSDFYEAGKEENMYWLTSTGIWRSDQLVKTDGIKEYFVERENIDLDDLVPEWTTNKWKHLRQFYFHLESPDSDSIEVNPFGISFGWSTNLMDPVDWLPESIVNLQTTDNGGKHKYDFRTTGRYLGMRMTFNGTLEIKMTGGDMDAEEAHGR
jgi:hypothetical protein